MYLSTVTKPAVSAAPVVPETKTETKVNSNVFALGTVSLVTDISSEMVTAILPLYLVLGLHVGPTAYGAVDGAYTGSTALLRMVGGYIADRVRHRKIVAGTGYAMSAVAKLGLLAAGGSVPAIGAVIAADRAGKGLRTAPRDALITLSTPEPMLGRAFGVHRMMDSIGAFAGPLVAMVVLATSGQSFDAVFVVSFCVAMIGVGLLALFVRDRRSARAPAHTVSARAVVDLLRAAPVRRLTAAACLLGVATIGDGFVYLLLQKRTDIGFGWFPLLAVGTNLGFLTFAAPLGRLADRVGRLRVIVGGYIALIAVYLLLYGPVGGWPLLVLTLALYGGFYAATDGVLMALAGPVLPPELRTTGIALVQTGQALAYAVSSVLFGLGWQHWGPAESSRIAAVGAVVAVAGTIALLRPGWKGQP